MAQKIADPADQADTIQISTFHLDGTLCGIEIELVQEINQNLSFTKVPLTPDYVMGIMNLRGQIVTVIDQSRKIGFAPATIGKESRVVIVRSKGEHIGLIVDQINDVITVSRSAIAPPPPNIKGGQGKFFKGVIQTGKHELLTLLDTEAILVNE